MLCNCLDVDVSAPENSCYIVKGMGEMLRVPPLKVLIDKQQSPNYRSHQVDGACSFFDEDSDLSFCNDKNGHYTAHRAVVRSVSS